MRNRKGEWACVREELSRLTTQRDKLASQIIQAREILADQSNYGREELIEELEGILE